ncbi:hypothetical protein C8J57DRAFT_1525755 [Mycena rebaudengoi]|nr:hypothetical protein C8J57DRAFT_1525755 [Mycena rebaudengoi]
MNPVGDEQQPRNIFAVEKGGGLEYCTFQLQGKKDPAEFHIGRGNTIVIQQEEKCKKTLQIGASMQYLIHRWCRHPPRTIFLVPALVFTIIVFLILGPVLLALTSRIGPEFHAESNAPTYPAASATSRPIELFSAQSV